MTLIKLAHFILACLPLSQPEGITRTWTFAGDAHGIRAAGFLHMEKGAKPFGGMWFAGEINGRTRLAGLNEGPWFGRNLERSDRTIMLDAEQPWVLGTVWWRGPDGVIDFLSADETYGEIPVKVKVR